MADRGFLIREELKAKGVTLICPAFQGPDHAQLSAKEVHSTGRMAEARKHVEKAIRRIKQFKILGGEGPLSMKPIIGRLFATCAFLTNFQTPIIAVSVNDSV